MPRIHLLIGAHLLTAPRPQKEAIALQRAGYEVSISGVWLDEASAAWDEAWSKRHGIPFTPALDLRSTKLSGSVRRLALGVRRRWSQNRFRQADARPETCHRADRFVPALLGLGARLLLAAAQRQPSDLTIAHSEAGLWAAVELVRAGRRVGVDFEDWFSRDLPPGARVGRPVDALARLEAELANRAAYVVTTSQALARALARAYHAPLPTVIYNSFPDLPIDERATSQAEVTPPSLHWFSQTIGPFRGLELLAASLPQVKHAAELALRGRLNSTNAAWLRRTLPKEWPARLLPWIAPEELPRRLAEHQIGLALDLPTIPSRALTISNKLFQYLQAGLAVIATRTPGHLEILGSGQSGGEVLRQNRPEDLAAALNRLLENRATLQAAQFAVRQIQHDPVWAWSRQEARLQNLVQALVPPGLSGQAHRLHRRDSGFARAGASAEEFSLRCTPPVRNVRT